jgi:hypothetical protein
LYTYLFQFGFLRKREDGSTSMTLLNPDNDGISKALGNVSGKRQSFVLINDNG